jgi:type I restriction enzyme, R subunit
MYVDKKLGGVNAVQTLSRLNRTHPEKKGTMVLDFANEADEIRKAFEPYYETTLLSEATDPNLLYEIQTRLADFPVYTEEADVEASRSTSIPRRRRTGSTPCSRPVVERFGSSEDEQHDFRGQLTDYVRLYAFLAQVLTFADADLEKLYVFARHLRRCCPPTASELPREVQQNIDMESYRIQQTGSGKIALERGPACSTPVSTKQTHGTADAGGAGDALAHHRRAERALRPEPRPRAPRDARPDDGEARRRRGARRRARVNTRENVRSPSTRRSST